MRQQAGMDEFDLQAEREAAAIRAKGAITPDRRRRNDVRLDGPRVMLEAARESVRVPRGWDYV